MAHTEDAGPGLLALNGSPERARPGRIPELIVFGPYRLLAKPRRLERAGSSVPLGDRAFEILRVLTERAGEIVTHSELMARVWGKVVVGEGSLRFHINALRKTLAQDGTQTQYIRNVPRRGYVFTAPVRAGMDSAEAPDSQPLELRTLPRRSAEIIGRASELKDIIALLNETSFVTVIGIGGAGKTTVVLEAAHRLREKKVLLIFDSCERVTEAAAILAEQILEGSPRSAILATSQEALRAGEIQGNGRGDRLGGCAPG